MKPLRLLMVILCVTSVGPVEAQVNVDKIVHDEINGPGSWDAQQARQQATQQQARQIQSQQDNTLWIVGATDKPGEPGMPASRPAFYGFARFACRPGFACKRSLGFFISQH